MRNPDPISDEMAGPMTNGREEMTMERLLKRLLGRAPEAVDHSPPPPVEPVSVPTAPRFVPPAPRPAQRRPPRRPAVDVDAQRRWAVIDVETTGGADAQIVEFGVIILDDNLREVARWETLVKPEVEMNPFALRVHGITKSMLKNAPPFVDVADDIQLLINGAWIAGHNVRFDLRMLNREYERLGGTVYYDEGYYDTMWDWVGKLEDIAELIEAPFSGLHRAMADVEVVAKLMNIIAPAVPEDVLCIDFVPDVVRPDGLTREEALPVVKCDAEPVILEMGHRITLTGMSSKDKVELEVKIVGRGLVVGGMAKKFTKVVVARHVGAGTQKEMRARELKIPVISFNQACGLLHVGTILGRGQ